MKTLSLRLDDELNTALEAVCAEQGRTKAEVVREMVRKYVEAARLKRALRDPQLARLYEQLSEDDIALSEAGMAEYTASLEVADRQ